MMNYFSNISDENINAQEYEMINAIKSYTRMIEFNINDYESAMNTLRKVEKTYWQYCCSIPHYPKLTFSKYFRYVCEIFKEEWNYNKYIALKTQYNCYKKSIPTAGAMIHYHENNNIYMLLVRNNRARVFSLPKGKQEKKEETIKEVAIREVLEETGLDISSYINNDHLLSSSDGSETESEEQQGGFGALQSSQGSQGSQSLSSLNASVAIETNKHYICKSVIYDVQLETKVNHFENYDKEEIVDIKWVQCEDILANPQLYSRQVKSACQIILDKYSINLGFT
jgi:8-oxo-dGTP pyrophosphatase MutT (NUDIX family)